MDFRTRDNSKLPLVTIGVLSYNYAEYIIDTLQSIYQQTYPHIELFIVDDASTDNSAELAQAWIREKNLHCTFIKHPKNMGRNTGVNTILNNSHGKFLAWFATDDIMHPERLERQVKALMAAHEDVAVCYTDAELINENGESRGLYSEKHKSPFLEGNVFESFFNAEFFMAAPTILFRRSTLDLVGEYDKNLTAEDYGMWMRILPVYKVKYCNFPGVKYRIKENWNPSEEHNFNLKQLYHKDRVMIYAGLVKQLAEINKFNNIRMSAIAKVNFHLIHLQLMGSVYFPKMLKYLFSRSFFQIKYIRLVKNHFSYLFKSKKPELVL